LTPGLPRALRRDEIEEAVMPSAARVRMKVMVVILLIGIASPVLG